MLLAALVDLGADPRVLSAFERTRHPLLRRVSVLPERIRAGGFRATRLRIEIDEEDRGRDREEVFDLLEAAASAVSASPASTRRARDVLAALLEAEAEVHGLETSRVHLHEAGRFDTILDALGYYLLLEDLGEEEIRSTIPAVGGGTLRCAHGLLPVPAPAVLAIARSSGLPLRGGPIEEELLTPTGAALLAHSARILPALPSVIPLAVGYGAGSRERESPPNLLRAVRCRSAEEGSERVSLIEATLDDATGEEIGRALEALSPECLELHCLSGLGKKGRPVFLIRLLSETDRVDGLIARVLELLPTLGVRHWPVGRTRMERRVETREIRIGDRTIPLRVKTSHLGDLRREKLESDDRRLLDEALRREAASGHPGEVE